MALDYMARLRDGISGPAGAATRAVAFLRSGLRQLTQTATEASAAFDRSAGRFRNANGQFVAGATRSLTAANLLADGIKAVGRAAIATGAWFGKTVLGAAEFKESATLRLSNMLGNSAEGRAEFMAAVKIAEKTRFDPKEAVNALAGLSQVLSGTNERRAYFGAVADVVSASAGGSDEMGRMIEQVKQSLAVGKAKMDDIKPMIQLGLRYDSLYAAIGKNFGLRASSQEQLAQKAQKLISSGQVQGGAWTKSLFEALMGSRGSGSAGKLAGQVAEDMGSSTISGLISNIKNGFDTLIMAQDTEWPGLIAFKDTLKTIASLFDSSSKEGAGILSVFSGVTNAMAPIFNAIRGDLKGMSKDLAKGVPPSFITGVQASMWAVYGLAKGLAYLGGWTMEAIGGYVKLGERIGDTTFEITQWFAELPARIWGGITGAVSAMYEGGANLVKGLVQGIRDAAGAVTDAVAGLGNDAINALKAALRISSPSRAFAELGLWSAKGFGEGLQRGGDGVATNARGMGEAAAGAVRGMAGGGAGPISVAVTLNLASGASDPKAVAAELLPQIGAATRDAVDQALQRLAQEG